MDFKNFVWKLIEKGELKEGEPFHERTYYNLGRLIFLPFQRLAFNYNDEDIILLDNQITREVFIEIAMAFSCGIDCFKVCPVTHKIYSDSGCGYINTECTYYSEKTGCNWIDDTMQSEKEEQEKHLKEKENLEQEKIRRLTEGESKVSVEGYDSFLKEVGRLDAILKSGMNTKKLEKTITMDVLQAGEVYLMAELESQKIVRLFVKKSLPAALNSINENSLFSYVIVPENSYKDYVVGLKLKNGLPVAPNYVVAESPFYIKEKDTKFYLKKVLGYTPIKAIRFMEKHYEIGYFPLSNGTLAYIRSDIMLALKEDAASEQKGNAK